MSISKTGYKFDYSAMILRLKASTIIIYIDVGTY